MAVKWDHNAAIAVAMLGDKGEAGRKRVRQYIEGVARHGHEVADVLSLLSQHANGDGDDSIHADDFHVAQVALMSNGTRRVMLSLSAAVHIEGNWPPQGIAQDCDQEGYPIVGILIARFMMGTPFGRSDALLFDRLVSTLDTDELMGMVCTTAAMMGALGFTQDALRELVAEHVKPVDQAEPVDQGDAVGSAYDTEPSSDRPIYSGDTDE